MMVLVPSRTDRVPKRVTRAKLSCVLNSGGDIASVYGEPCREFIERVGDDGTMGKERAWRGEVLRVGSFLSLDVSVETLCFCIVTGLNLVLGFGTLDRLARQKGFAS